MRVSRASGGRWAVLVLDLNMPGASTRAELVRYALDRGLLDAG